jgi:hypothetical protein
MWDGPRQVQNMFCVAQRFVSSFVQNMFWQDCGAPQGLTALNESSACTTRLEAEACGGNSRFSTESIRTPTTQITVKHISIKYVLHTVRKPLFHFIQFLA